MTRRDRFLRRLSLLLLALWIGVLATSFVQRRLLRRAPVASSELEDVAFRGEDQAIRVHRDFVYTDTIGIEPNFRVAARETVEYASGWFELRDVEISLFHRGEVAYGLAAATARFHKERNEAVVQGEAQLSLSGGVALRAEGFVLHGNKRLLESQGPVTFAGPGWAGLAGQATAFLSDDTFELRDRVTLTRQAGGTREGLVMLAPKVSYLRQRAAVLFPDGVTLLRGRLRLVAGGGEVHLSGPEGSPREVRLVEGVDLFGALDDGSQVTGAAFSSTIRIDAADRMALTLEGERETGWVTVEWRDPSSSGWRRMRAWRVVGEGVDGSWEWLEGQGRACLTEYSVIEPARHLESERLRITFVGGRPAGGTATKSVRLAWGERWARGETMEFSLGSWRFSLLPRSGDRVELGAPGMTARCDRLDGERASGLVADGDVTGSLERGTLWSGDQQDAVRFAASTLSFDTGGNLILLKNNARLWQGKRLLKADTLAYDTVQETVDGQGNVVVTSVISGRDEGIARIVSRRLHYDERSSLITFDGEVVLQDPNYVVRSQRLVVSLGPEGQVLLGVFEGGVEFRESPAARTVKAKRARMVTSEDLVELWGDPVLVTEPSGNQIKANHLRWLRSTGSLVVVGGEDNPSETLYHPQKPIPKPGAGGGPGSSPKQF